MAMFSEIDHLNISGNVAMNIINRKVFIILENWTEQLLLLGDDSILKVRLLIRNDRDTF